MLAVMWNTVTVKRLRELWASGQSAGQIAQPLGCSRSAAAAKLQREGLHRGHKPPTAKPVIVSMPKRVHPVPGDPPARQRFVRRQLRDPVKNTKSELRAMLAEAVKNTG